MSDLTAYAGTIADLLLVILGFGAIVFVHELGHFLAARWAGIRVLAFALGFGPAVVSYRKGMGVRRGSTEAEYRRLVERAAQRTQNARGSGDGAPGASSAPGDAARGPNMLAGISPTEYRLNALPFGGYVKMLGQDDLDPGAVSDARDSYQSAPIGKRMVVISAGVIMNVLMAAVLFVIVFMVGLRTEPPRIGDVVQGMAAAKATPVSADGANIGEGLRPGDLIVSVDDAKVATFNDLVVAAGMSGPNDALVVKVRRGTGEGDGTTDLTFRVMPERSRITGLLDIGVLPAASNNVFATKTSRERAEFDKAMARLGLPGLEPGSTLARVRVDGADFVAQSASGTAWLRAAAHASDGRPIEAVFRMPGSPTSSASPGTERAFTLTPRPSLMSDAVNVGPDRVVPVEHLAGLCAPMSVVEVMKGTNAEAAGLREGDVFARVGALEFPRTDEGIREIGSRAGDVIPIVVLRRDEAGEWTRISLGDVPVTRRGTIGFYPQSGASSAPFLARSPEQVRGMSATSSPPPASRLGLVPGTRLVGVGEGASLVETEGFDDAVVAVRRLMEQTAPGADGVTRVPLAVIDPGGIRSTVWLTLDGEERARVLALGWSTGVAGIFEPEQFLLKADGPVAAMGMGLHETRRIMKMTYMTFVRLFQGTVKVEHLRGPVGIAHAGTIIADRGVIWLLFFLGLISINLAVINFMPMPIVDGGQFVFLLVEWIRGRPAPIAVQNIATIAGLVLIGSLFLVVTFNDVRNLLGL